jgi:hypothetical protein
MKIFADMSVTSAPHRPKAIWGPARLFANGARGAWYDPSRPDTVFQDTGKTTLVSAPGQPVGLICDRSGFGLDARQSATARPTFGVIPATGRRNLANQTENLAVRSGTGVTMSLTGPATPQGAVSVMVSKSALAFANVQLMSGLAASRQYTVSILVRAGSLTDAGLAIISDSGSRINRASFNMTTGSTSLIQQLGGAGPTLTHFEDLGEWKRIAITATTGTAGGVVFFYPGLYTATTVGDIFVSSLQVEFASAPTPYQRVLSVVDITEAGTASLPHLHFDGVDDSLLTQTLDLSHSSQVTVIAGLEKLGNPAARGTVVNFVDNGFRNFSLEVPMPTTSDTRWLHAGQTVLRSVQHPDPGLGERILYTGTSDLAAPQLRLRANGALIGQSTDATGGGTFKTGPLCIGDYVVPVGRRFFGRLYGLIVIDRVLNAAEIAQAEGWMARRMGITL